MPPMQPPMPRPIQPGFIRNDANSMPNTGWRNAYQSPIGTNYMDNARPSLPGFYISDPGNVSARDVPMDGSISFFPANDLSYIIIKQWNGNGMISEARYVPAPPPAQENEQKQQPSDSVEKVSEVTQRDASKDNSEIVEAITAMMSDQTQRLTAAFSQIGMAFTTLQEKLDNLGQFSTVSLQAQPQVASNAVPNGKKMKGKPQEEAKDE